VKQQKQEQGIIVVFINEQFISHEYFSKLSFISNRSQCTKVEKYGKQSNTHPGGTVERKKYRIALQWK
jgi:hypothetical protein